MSGKPKILFVTAPIGSGHVRAAQAIAQAMNRLRPDAETTVANIFDFLSPLAGQTILRCYLKILELCPSAYSMAYNWGNHGKAALVVRELISRYFAGKMNDYITQYAPSAVICTHATPAGLAAFLKKNSMLKVPALAVITDFDVHRFWAYPELDYYFIAHDGMRECLVKYGVSYGKIKTSGIPVDELFSYAYKQENLARTLSLKPDQNTILVMGGGAGVLPMDEIIAACDEVAAPVQLVAVTGKNMAMYQKLSRMKSKLSKELTVLGFVENIHEWMSAADLLISKPGGLTSTEALCSGLPMVIYRPIPGQEEANTRYLVAHHAAKRADSVNEIKTIVTHLFERPEQLEKLGRCTAELARPRAASDIAEHVLSLIENK